jgi:hypothetical protein
MIREIIKPQYTSFTINIPTEYIDKEIELIMFPIDTPNISKNKQKFLKGVFNQYASKSKKALEKIYE